MQKTISKSTKTTKFIQFDGLSKESITEACRQNPLWF